MLKSPLGQRRVRFLGNRPDDLHAALARRLAGTIGAGSVSPVVACHRIAKCAATSATAGPGERCAPRRASPACRFGVRRAVVPVTGEIGQVDAADERQGAIDDDQLLVMAVHRAVALVEGASNPRAAHQADP